MADKTRVRRNIHTYPFKYRFVDAGEFFAPETAAIYLHIPFCNTKCHFCDYVVYVDSKADLRERYIEALCREIGTFADSRAFPAFRIDAVYFGGGTPGLLEAEQLLRVLDTVRDNFELTEGCEIAVEFDPGCVELDKVTALRQAGFNRLSVGVQAFDDELLRKNNRPHTLADCYEAWQAIRRSGFTHTNIDLIYPLIGLDLEGWRASLRQAIDLQPACITAYPLEVWPKTAYYDWLTRNKERLPDPELEVEMCRTAFDVLEGAGFRRLSTSGYYHPERTGSYCRFLDYYWRTWPMIGFGVSAKSVIHDRLYTNIRPIRQYIERIQAGEPVIDFGTVLTKEQEMRRVMIRGLKMCEVSKTDYRKRFGVPMEATFAREIADLVERGLLIDEPDRIYLSREGQVFSTNVYETFYTADDLREPEENEVQYGISTLIQS